jgi:hypothetical protein
MSCCSMTQVARPFPDATRCRTQALPAAAANGSAPPRHQPRVELGASAAPFTRMPQPHSLLAGFHYGLPAAMPTAPSALVCGFPLIWGPRAVGGRGSQRWRRLRALAMLPPVRASAPPLLASSAPLARSAMALPLAPAPASGPLPVQLFQAASNASASTYVQGFHQRVRATRRLARCATRAWCLKAQFTCASFL